MKLTYENLVRSVFLLLLIVGSIVPTVSPALTIISFIVFEYLIRKFERPAAAFDHTEQIKQLENRLKEVEHISEALKNDVNLGKIGQAFQRTK